MKEIEPNINTDNEAQAMYRTMLTIVAKQQPTEVTRMVIDNLLPFYVRVSSNKSRQVRKTLDYIQKMSERGIPESRRAEMLSQEPILKLANAWNCLERAETSYSRFKDKETEQVSHNAYKRVEKLRKEAMELIQTTDLSGVKDIRLTEAVDRFTVKEEIK